MRLDFTKGTIASLLDRRSNKELLDTARYGGNELVLEEEKDPDMEGDIQFTGTEIRSSQFPPDSITEMDDALGIRIRIEGPFLGGRRRQEISLYNDLPRIDFRTELLGFPGHDGMLVAVLPLRNTGETKMHYETHNAVTERPDGIYYAQTWMDAESGGDGVAFINNGMGGYQTEGGVIRMILLRSVAHYRGYYSPNASEAGSRSFQYSLYPHAGGWATSGVVQQAHSFNSPLRVLSTNAHPGSLPPVHSFLSVERGHFEVTALKKAENGQGFILRGYETMGEAGRVRLRLELPFKSAALADLLERTTRPVSIEQGSIEFDCRPFEFVTLRLSLERSKK